MASPMKKHNCRACRRGLRCKANSELAKSTVRKHRRVVKAALRKGEEPPKTFSLEYTD